MFIHFVFVGHLLFKSLYLVGGLEHESYDFHIFQMG